MGSVQPWGSREEWQAVSGYRAASSLPDCCLHPSSGPEGASSRETPAQKLRRERLWDQLLSPLHPPNLGGAPLLAAESWREGDLETACAGKDEN